MAPLNPAQSSDVLILGAGPAGLVLGRELKQRGVSFLILERGPAVAHSWHGMPTQMKLLSPWKANWLPGSNSGIFAENQEISRAEYRGWLQAYARDHGLPVLTNMDVREVTKAASNAFHVQTPQAAFTARVLVNATGYFSNPYTPTIPGAADSRILQRHTAAYKDPDTVQALVGKKHPLILIIGKRLSAGQTMVEFVEAGCTVALSHRGTLQFGAGPLAWWFFFRIHPWLEALKLKGFGENAKGVQIRMMGGKTRRLVRDGMVRVFPEVTAFEREELVFRNGERLRPDIVIYATGFRPALQHLAALDLALDKQTGLPQVRGMESTSVPGLFFLGLDGLRNFQSRFLRGIRNDAVALAAQLDRQLRTGAAPVAHFEPHLVRAS